MITCQIFVCLQKKKKKLWLLGGLKRVHVSGGHACSPKRASYKLDKSVEEF